MKNKKVIVIGITISVFIIIVATLVSLFFFTDIFKTNKQLFYKSIGDLHLIDYDFLKQCQIVNEKIDQNSHSSTMDMYVSTSKFTDSTEIADVQKILTVKSNGLKNTLTNQEYKDYIIAFPDNSNIVLKLIKDDNTYAIGADNILAKYIAIENKQLKEFSTKLGITDSSNIPDSIPEINYEELFKIYSEALEYFKSNYFEEIYNTIDESHFYKLTYTDKSTSYGISLSEKEIIEIIKLMLEKMKNDSNLLDYISNKAKQIGNESYSIENIQEQLQEMMNNLSSKEIQDDYKEFIKIETIRKGKKISKIKFEINNKNNDELLENANQETEKLNKKITWNIDFSEANKLIIAVNENDTEVINILINYKYNTNNFDITSEISIKDNNSQDSLDNTTIRLQQQTNNHETDNITQTVFADITNDTGDHYQINMNKSISIKQDIQISKLTTENSVIINDLTIEQLDQLWQAIINRTKEVYGNDLNVFILPIDLNDSVNEATQRSLETTRNNEISLFNNKFLSFEGNDKSSEQVKSLIMMVLQNNTALERKVSINNLITISDLKNLENEINTSKTYHIQMNYDENGYVKNITIQ